MKIGLYFGTYNPIHNGHLVIADYMINHTNLESVWMVVSPQNPLKIKDSLLPDEIRLKLVKLALSNANSKIKASDFEFNLTKPSYTFQSLNYIQNKQPDDTFVLIMGEDNLRQFYKWKDYNKIVENFEIYVYPRMESQLEIQQNKLVNFSHKNIKLFDVPIINMSSSEVRLKISENQDVTKFIAPNVLKEIKKQGYFKKE